MNAVTSLISIFMGVLAIGALLFIIFKLAWGNFNRRKFVDVDIYNINNEGLVERESFDCMIKPGMDTNANVFVLAPLFSKGIEFPYLQDYIYVRTKDRKRVESFIKIRGSLVPFVPAIKTTEKKIQMFGKDKKPLKDKDGKDRYKTTHEMETSIQIKDYAPEDTQRRFEYNVKNQILKYDNWASEGRGGMKWQFIVVGLLLLGGVIYFVIKYSGGGA